MQTTNKMWLIVVVGAFFVLLAVTGSVLTSRHMNETATAHGGSAGRAGDPMPNTLQEQQDKASARGASTTGTNSGGSVPPASR
jgi:hypothetical protein